MKHHAGLEECEAREENQQNTRGNNGDGKKNRECRHWLMFGAGHCMNSDAGRVAHLECYHVYSVLFVVYSHPVLGEGKMRMIPADRKDLTMVI